MAILKISRDTASQLYATRSLTGYDRKTKKSAIIAKIKADNGISRQTKLRINILNEDDPMFLVVRDKRSNQPLRNSLPEPVIAIVPGAVAEAASTPAVKTQPEAVSKTVSKTVSKAPAKKPVAKPVAKKALAVSKAPAKKPVTKPVPAAKKVPVAKPVPLAKKAAAVKPLKVAAAKPAAKTPAKTLGSPTKTAKHSIEVRPSIDNKKVRLGYASSEAEKAKMIAAYKASI